MSYGGSKGPMGLLGAHQCLLKIVEAQKDYTNEICGAHRGLERAHYGSLGFKKGHQGSPGLKMAHQGLLGPIVFCTQKAD